MELDIAEMLFAAAAIAIAPNILVAVFELLRDLLEPLRTR